MLVTNPEEQSIQMYMLIEYKILISLIGTREEAPTSYELIRLLAKRFNIYYFLDVINNGREKGLIDKIDFPSKQMGSYELTEKGLRELKNIIRSAGFVILR